MIGTMLSRSCIGLHGTYLKEALKQGWRCAESWLWMCVSLLNIPSYIFIVWRFSILSKLNSNNPYRIWAELYFPNINYLIILDTWPIWPSRRPRWSRFTSWSYLSFGPILFTAHLLVWPSYGDNRCALKLAHWPWFVFQIFRFNSNYCKLQNFAHDSFDLGKLWNKFFWINLILF
jgi:hypothetical protein